MKILSIFFVFILSACSTQVINMTDGVTPQVFDLTDSEADGVISARDECPSSSAGVRVENNGCGTQTIETRRRKLEVNFDTNSFVVKNKYLTEIGKLADFLIKYPSTTVTVEGHTSIRGTAKLNKTLSQNRAQAIKNILVRQFNVEEDRITAIGYGFERLLLEGDDEYIHARNRRIVAEISSDVSLQNMKWTIYSVDNEVE